MTTGSQDPRAAILKRRALLLGSALAALGGAGSTGCPPAGQQESSNAPIVGVASIDGGATLPDPTGEHHAGRPIKPKETMPPLVVPEGVQGVARSMYEHLNKKVPPIHAKLSLLEKVERGLGGCSILDAKCEERWKSLSKEYAAVSGATDGLRPRCPGSSEAAQQYSAHVGEHQAFLRKRQERLLKRIQNRLKKDGEGALAKWREFSTQRIGAMICLSCMDW